MDSADVKLLVEAQDRTTHAVRAIAFLFINTIVFALIGGIIIVASIASDDHSYYSASRVSAGIGFGYFVIGAGGLIALISAIVSVVRSAVPQANDGQDSTLKECPKCGNYNHETSSECTNCSSPLPAAPAPPRAFVGLQVAANSPQPQETIEPGQVQCINCGEANPEAEKRCHRCNWSLANARP